MDGMVIFGGSPQRLKERVVPQKVTDFQHVLIVSKGLHREHRLQFGRRDAVDHLALLSFVYIDIMARHSDLYEAQKIYIIIHHIRFGAIPQQTG